MLRHYYVSDVEQEGIVKKAVEALPILWLVFGIVLACGSYYGYCLLKQADRNAEQMTHRIEPKKTSQKRTQQKSKEATYTTDQIKPVTPEAFADAQLQYEKIVNQWGIGALYIPSAGIQTKLLAGMANQNLMVGVGTYYPNQQLGKGNYVGLAHNLVQGGGALGNLPKTALNQVFYATDFTRVYEYVATKNEVVNQSRGELLEVPKSNEDALLTLIRCEGGLYTANRAIVQGVFHKSYPADQASTEVKLGLGLVEERAVKPIEQPKENKSTEKPTETSKANQNQESKTNKRNKPIYSTIQRACISAFATVSQSPILLSTGYLVLLSVLLKLATFGK